MYVVNGDREGRSSKALNSGVVALLGTVLGIVGTIATTSVATHYAVRDHIADRAEARAKERREELTKTYAKVLDLLLSLQQNNVLADSEAGHERWRSGAIKDELREVMATLQLVGSERAYEAFADAVYAAFSSIKLRQLKGSSPAEAEKLDKASTEAYDRFVRLVRTEIAAP